MLGRETVLRHCLSVDRQCKADAFIYLLSGDIDFVLWVDGAELNVPRARASGMWIGRVSHGRDQLLESCV